MLHTVNKSPFEKNSLATCFRLAKKDSDILLIEDAVYAAIAGTEHESEIKRALDKYDIYALGPDLKARGIKQNRVIDGIKIVGYDGFVKLATENDQVQSWL